MTLAAVVVWVGVLWLILSPMGGAVAYVTVDNPDGMARLSASGKVIIEDYSLAKTSYLIKVTTPSTMWPNRPDSLEHALNGILGEGEYQYYPISGTEWLLGRSIRTNQ